MSAVIYACTTFGLFVFFPGAFLSSRVIGTCPVTTDLVMRVNVRTTTRAPIRGRLTPFAQGRIQHKVEGAERKCP